MRAIVDPFARRGDPLAGGDDGGVADHGHQIAVSARLRPQNAEAVLRVVEGDPLDEARERFLCRRLRIRLHTVRGILLFRQDAAIVMASRHCASWTGETETGPIACWVVSRLEMNWEFRT